MSGTYDLRRFYDGPLGEDFAASSPLHFLPDLDGEALDRLRQRFVVLASGEGANEDIGESWHGGRTCSAARASPTASTRGASSGRTTGRCGGRCCRSTWRTWPDMGTQTAQGTTERQTAIRWMLRDLQALEHMLAERMFETDITRIGAEQEMFLVDGSWQPSPRALAILADLADGHFTTEVGAFNLELNLDPQVFTGTCLSLLEAQLDQLLAVARAVAGAAGLNVVLAGILPTIRKGDLSMDNMVQNPRYLALNTALMSLRGEDYELHIKGTDELRVRQDSVMAEACNASFQVHLQVDARRLRQPVQRRPAARRAGAGVRHQLAGPVRQAAVGGDPDRPVRAGGRHAPARTAHARSQRPRHVRQRLGDDLDHRAVPGGHHAVPPGARAGRLRRPLRRARRRPDADAPGVAAAHRHGLALEPRLLRHHRRRAAPAHREPRAAVRADRRRRGRQRRAVARSDARRRTPAIRRSTGCCRSRSPARTS